ncbi:MAG: hydroxylamine dehydrogenase [Clostridiales bacterium]|nr:hydroxylamine dehydrogenase [Clostridiales bacterium]MDN5282923.1 hydroxylamine dehydrogenase [Candidatus Ozemobacter sp.]
MSKKAFFLILLLLIISGLANAQTSEVVTSDESARCLNCHNSRQKKLVESWEKSKHARNRVGCYECHKADPGDSAAKNGHFGFSVQLPVSPLRCASCHPNQYESFASSSHALAYETIRNAEIASVAPALFESSCAICHGNELKMSNGKPARHKWPNHGIGRINTDGSRGNCVACHSHHEYELAVARSAETCGRCHRGQTGPALESWRASRHGSNWNLAKVHTDFNSTRLIPSDQPLTYPDCFVCHIAATGKNENDSTHNPGERISWKLAAFKSTHHENWGPRRLKMQSVCRSCHGNSQVDLFYRRFDASVMEINRLVARAAEGIASDSHEFEALKAAAMAAKIGAAMMSPIHIRDGFNLLREKKY